MAPTHRPLWLVVLVGMMLAAAAQLLASALPTLVPRLGERNAALVVGGVDTGELTGDQALRRELTIVNAAVERDHPRAVRVHAAAKLGLALLLFYAVAASLARDAAGRAVSIAAAWMGIAYHLGDLVFLLAVMRRNVIPAVPGLVDALIRAAGVPNTPETRETLAATVRRLTLVAPLLTTLVGVGFSIVLLAFFGGRRGRTLYGLEPAHERAP